MQWYCRSVYLCVLQYLEEILKYCNYVFTLVFVIEAILKLFAFGLRRFFKERYPQSRMETEALKKHPFRS